MSFQGMTWVMDRAKGRLGKSPQSPGRLLVLLTIGNHVGSNLRGCYAATQTLADECLMSRESVKRHLDWLEEQGLIRRGDQSMVQHLRADRRPVVWDLAGASFTTGHADPPSFATTGHTDPPSQRTSSTTGHTDPPQDAKEATGGQMTAHGGSNDGPRGVTVTPKPKELNLKNKPKDTHTRELTPAEAKAEEQLAGARDSLQAAKAAAKATARAAAEEGKTSIPDDFAITEGMRAWAVAAGHAQVLDLDAETEAFCEFYMTSGTKWRYWDLVWKRWIRKNANDARDRAQRSASVRTFRADGGTAPTPMPDRHCSTCRSQRYLETPVGRVPCPDCNPAAVSAAGGAR